MGAWGSKAFENDAALDWFAQLESEGVTALRSVLSRVAAVEPDHYLDVDDGSSAIAAAEIVAAAMGDGRDRVPEPVKVWLHSNAPAIGDEDVVIAKCAVERVLSGASELRELWEENGPETGWHSELRLLLAKLAGDAAASTTAPSSSGPAEGRAAEVVDERQRQALLTFLAARGLAPSERQLARIQASRDPVEIRRWLSRVVEVATVDALLNGG